MEKVERKILLKDKIENWEKKNKKSKEKFNRIKL